MHCICTYQCYVLITSLLSKVWQGSNWLNAQLLYNHMMDNNIHSSLYAITTHNRCCFNVILNVLKVIIIISSQWLSHCSLIPCNYRNTHMSSKLLTEKNYYAKTDTSVNTRFPVYVRSCVDIWGEFCLYTYSTNDRKKLEQAKSLMSKTMTTLVLV